VSSQADADVVERRFQRCRESFARTFGSGVVTGQNVKELGVGLVFLQGFLGFIKIVCEFLYFVSEQFEV
jgi:hypothetical protein